MDPKQIITSNNPSQPQAVYSEQPAPKPAPPASPAQDYFSASSRQNRRVKTSYITFIAIIFAFAIFAAFILWTFGYYLREAKEITPPSSGY